MRKKRRKKCAGCQAFFLDRGFVYLLDGELYHAPCIGPEIAGEAVKAGAKELRNQIALRILEVSR